MMLSVLNVSKSYGSHFANKNVTFTLEDRQITVLLGENGAGKSTIIKCITGFLNYTGYISLNDVSINDLNVKRQIAYIPEVPELYNELTVYQHFQFIANAYHVEDYEEKAMTYLDMFHLTPKKDELCGSLSKGMKQKVSIICALILNPKVLILDEPLIGLDPDAIRTLKETLSTLKQECCILISTHLLDSVSNLWDQVLIMKHGEIVFHATKDTFDDTNSLEDIYFGYTEKVGESDGTI
ncbi:MULTISPECIES: ABC transporter ATP-binding protein [unclassified Granulicatella]|uniref:ABC transporter ATP-binding protein n=1 Tax=unclassified Granulicatella TaxID=2630493 RepID=UPI0019679336|nr:MULTISPECIES: ABC transporter ATP-binding protein [unclassified Granulicatella]